MTSPPVALVLSPHLDDAVLSASARLAAGAHVVTVFAGIPPEDAPRGEWDVLTRAGSAAARVRERRAEDVAALAVFPATFQHWDFLDGQHRSEAADVAAIAARIRPLLGSATELWAPAGIVHPDHAAVSDAALAAAVEAGLEAVTLYADVPHAIPYGWPESVSGEPDPGYLDRDAWLDDQLKGRGFDLGAMDREVVRLDEETVAAKRRALLAYPTQLAAVGMDASGISRSQSLIRFEVAWTTSPRDLRSR